MSIEYVHYHLTRMRQILSDANKLGVTYQREPLSALTREELETIIAKCVHDQNCKLEDDTNIVRLLVKSPCPTCGQLITPNQVQE